MKSLSSWCTTYGVTLVLLFCGVVCGSEDWVTLTDKEARSLDAYDGKLFVASSKDGLLIIRHSDTKPSDTKPSDTKPSDTVVEVDPFFQNSDVKKAFVFVTRRGELDAVYVVANSTLFTSDFGPHPYKWRRVFKENDTREIIDIHGQKDTIAFLAKEKPEDGNHNDATGRNTIRSTIWVASGLKRCTPNKATSSDSSCDRLESAASVGEFAASRVFVSPEEHIFTYGDIYGPYSPDIGVSVDKGRTWRHTKSVAGAKDGRIFSTAGIVYLAQSEVGLMRSYDVGRSFRQISKLNGIPDDRFTDVVASGRVVFLGTANNGLYISTDEGNSFPFHSSKGQKGFPSNKVSDLAFDPRGPALYVATDAGVALKSHLDKGGKRKTENVSWLSKVVFGAEEKSIY